MSDDTARDDAAPATADDVEDTSDGATEDTAAAPASPRGLRSPLTRDSDMVARPGFRNPSNARSKALRKSGSKKRRKKK